MAKLDLPPELMEKKPMPPVNENEIVARLAALKIKCDGNHGGPPCADPECWSAPENNAGLLGEIPPLKILLLNHEADYVGRLVASDLQRMTENRDHAVSHGMRGYAPPDMQMAESVLHSFNMAKTSAAIEAIEALEEQRADAAAVAEIKEREAAAAEAARYFAGDQDNKPGGSE